MPIQFDCENCQKKLKVPESAAGKRGRCNECGHLNTIPSAASAETTPAAEPINSGGATTAAATASGSETYNVKSAVNGAVFGPADSATLQQWLNEGRITPNCQLQQTGTDAWTMASNMFPTLGGSAAAAATTGGASDQFAQFQQSSETQAQTGELNPYAPNLTPHTNSGPEVRREIVPTAGNIGFCISHGWKTWTENFGLLLAVSATIIGVNWATQILQTMVQVGLSAAGDVWLMGIGVGVVFLVSMAIQMWLTLGFIKVCCQLCLGERTEYATLFGCAGRVPYAMLLLFLIYLPFLVVGGGIFLLVGPGGIQDEEAGVALLATIFGGLTIFMLAMLTVWPMFFLLADTKLGIGQVIGKGFSIGLKNCLIAIPIFFVAGLAGMSGIVACVVGIIATIPVSYTMIATAYLNMSGQLRAQ